MTKTAAILGGGVIGGGWAARFLLMGWDVRVFDPDPEAERKINEVLTNARRSLPGLSDGAMPDEGRMSFHADLADAVGPADWIQESVPERLEIKHKVFASVQAALSRGCGDWVVHLGLQAVAAAGRCCSPRTDRGDPSVQSRLPFATDRGGAKLCQ